MPAAWDACFGDNASAAGRKDNGFEECPSFDDIMSFVEEEFMDDGCVLAELGWIDEEGNEMQDVIDADLATLAQGVQDGLSEEGHAECVEDVLAEMDEKYSKCADQYNEEEADTLENVGYKIASYKCFMGMFKEACGNYIMSMQASG